MSIIMNNGVQAFEVMLQYLSEEHFITPKERALFDACKWIYEDGSTMNKTSIMKCLESQKDNHGTPKINLMSKDGNHNEELANIKLFAAKDGIDDIYTYARIVLDEYVVTKNIEMCSRVSNEKTAGKQIKIIEEYAPMWYSSDVKTYQTASDIINEMSQAAKNGVMKYGQDIYNSLPLLSDHLILAPTNTTVIAGDSGHGKSSLAIQLVVDIASQRVIVIDQDTNKPILNDMFEEITRPRTVLFLSMEMEKHEIIGKLFCARYNMSWNEMKSMPEKKFAELAEQMSKVLKTEMPNLVIESGEMSLRDCKKHIANVDKKFGGIDVVVFDHIGLLSDVYENGMNKQNERYSYASRYIKMQFAVKMKTHCIILSQLNKAPQDKFGKQIHTPNNDRLFGASGIKQDATNIIFVYREEAVEEETTVITVKGNPQQIRTHFITRIIVTKSRYGELMSAKPVGWIPYTQQIVPLQLIAKWNLLQSKDNSFRLNQEQLKDVWDYQESMKSAKKTA